MQTLKFNYKNQCSEVAMFKYSLLTSKNCR